MQILRSVLSLIGAAFLLQAQAPDFTPPTPLFAAVLRGDEAATKRLLDAGADPNEGRFIGTTTLIAALMQQTPGVARILIAKGADVKATDGAGSTTLMWAAATETGSPDMVNELLRLGADPNTKNKLGETALTWALRRGYTPVVTALKAQGASDAFMVKQSIEKAVALLQSSGQQFSKVSTCASCHQQSVPQMAYQAARERGFAVDAAASEQQVKSVLAMYRPNREPMLEGKENLPNAPVTVSYALLGLAAEGYRPDATTEAMAHLIATRQFPNGSFATFAARPPIESGPVSATALSLRALQLYGKDAAAKIARAQEWLTNVQPRTSEERSMKLLGLAWAKANVSILKVVAAQVLAEQRPDGGWAQLPDLETDAYATGQALVALLTSGQLKTSDAAYQRGVGYLLRTQRTDGSWLVRSRVFPFQPYKESGFPHGKDQWISSSGTAWSVMALSLGVPAAEMQSQVSGLE